MDLGGKRPLIKRAIVLGEREHKITRKETRTDKSSLQEIEDEEEKNRHLRDDINRHEKTRRYESGGLGIKNNKEGRKRG